MSCLGEAKRDVLPQGMYAGMYVYVLTHDLL